MASGKTYKVYAAGANEISIKNATAVSGTLTQIVDIPEEFADLFVTYVAYHGLVRDGASGLLDPFPHELGSIYLSEDGQTVTATYAVSGFSLFII